MARRRATSTASTSAPDATVASPAPSSPKVIVKRPAAPIRAASMTRAKVSRIPAILRFPLIVLLSLTISSALHSGVKEITAGDLASVSKRVETWPEISALIGWRGVELGLAWVLGYDSKLILLRNIL